MDKEEFSFEYYNTFAILLDFFTKPLQGSLFRSLRGVIMGWVHVDILQDYVPPRKKEPVENHVSGDKPEIRQEVTYTQIVTASRIKSVYGF